MHEERGNGEDHVLARQLGPGAGSTAILGSPVGGCRQAELIEGRLHRVLDRDLRLLRRRPTGDIDVDQAAETTGRFGVNLRDRKPANHLGDALPRIQVPELVRMAPDLGDQIERKGSLGDSHRNPLAWGRVEPEAVPAWNGGIDLHRVFAPGGLGRDRAGKSFAAARAVTSAVGASCAITVSSPTAKRRKRVLDADGLPLARHEVQSPQALQDLVCPRAEFGLVGGKRAERQADALQAAREIFWAGFAACLELRQGERGVDKWRDRTPGNVPSWRGRFGESIGPGQTGPGKEQVAGELGHGLLAALLPAPAGRSREQAAARFDERSDALGLLRCDADKV